MSAPARKRQNPIPQNNRDLSRLVVVSKDSPRASQALEQALGPVFSRVFETLRAIAPEGELLIGNCSPLSSLCRVEHASEGFVQLKDQTIDVSTGPFATILVEMRSDILVDGRELVTAEPAFAKLAPGNAALFRLELAGDLVALVMYWHPDSCGPLKPATLNALRAGVELSAQAACAADLALDVQAQQLYLESLRTEIEEVQQFYRQFSDAIRQCFWVVDLDSGKALVASDNFERVWGASANILGDGLTGFMHNVLPADHDRVLSDFHVKLGSEFDIELRVIGEDGEVRWIWLRGFPTRDHLSPLGTTASSGNRAAFRRIVLIADDITEKKTEEETSRAREAELVSRARMLAVGDLASGVAHEINNPLTVIVGKAAEIKRLAEKPDTSPKAIQDLADKIQKTSIRISEIVLSLKSLSRNEKNAAMSKTSIAKVIHDLRDMCTEKFKASNTRLDFAATPDALIAEMNPTMITQVLLNLLNNAFDAVAQEKDKWVKVEFTDDTDSVYLFVTDCGPGIPIKIRSRIFDPFFTTKEPGKGTGLGLSLAASVAAHHNGVLRLDTMHPYTRFVLQIPKKQPR